MMFYKLREDIVRVRYICICIHIFLFDSWQGLSLSCEHFGWCNWIVASMNLNYQSVKKLTLPKCSWDIRGGCRGEENRSRGELGRNILKFSKFRSSFLLLSPSPRHPPSKHWVRLLLVLEKSRLYLFWVPAYDFINFL